MSSVFTLLHLYLRHCSCRQLKSEGWEKRVTSARGRGCSTCNRIWRLSSKSASSNPEWWFQSWAPIYDIIWWMDVERKDAAHLMGGGEKRKHPPKKPKLLHLHPNGAFFSLGFSTKSHEVQRQGRITGLVTDWQTWKTVQKEGQMGVRKMIERPFGTT